MKLVTENFLLAISIFFIGTLLSIIISKVSKIFFLISADIYLGDSFTEIMPIA